MKRTPLKRKTPLKSGGALKRSAMPRRARPKSHKRGPERCEAFLEFVRCQPCLVQGCRAQSEAHHWGKRGMGQKCSDFEACPLCHDHHVEGWHRLGTLPGGTREEWLKVFAEISAQLVEMFNRLRAQAS